MNSDDLNNSVNKAINDSPYMHLANSMTEEDVKLLKERAKAQRIKGKAEKQTLEFQSKIEKESIKEKYSLLTWVALIIICIAVYLIITNF